MWGGRHVEVLYYKGIISVFCKLAAGPAYLFTLRTCLQVTRGSCHGQGGNRGGSEVEGTEVERSGEGKCERITREFR